MDREQDRAAKLADFLATLPQQQAKAISNLNEEMHNNGNSKDAPVREIMALLGDKWSHLILLILLSGTLGHAQLKRTIELISHEEAISQRILTLKLRQLERNGLVARNASSAIPPKVEYAPTLLGRELLEKSRAIVDWTANNASIIEAARSLFDQEKTFSTSSAAD